MNARAQPPVPKHPLVLLALSLAAGILLFNYSHPSTLAIIFALVVAVFLITAIILRRCYAIAVTLLLVVFSGTGYLLALFDARRVSPDRLVRMFEGGALESNEPLEVTGIIEGEPESAPDGFYLTLATEQIRLNGKLKTASGTVMLLAQVTDDSVRREYDALQLHHGTRIRVMALLDRDDDYRNPGVTPLTEFLERKGFDATGVIKSPLLVERLEDTRVFLPLALIYEWRRHLEDEFDGRFSVETAGVLDAVLLGNRHKVSREVADRFREGGAFHVLVIAGLHISFIAGLLFLLMRRLTRNRGIQFISIVTILFAYSLAVGAQPPVIRAALVFTLALFAPLVWRRANSLNVIAGAAILLLVWRSSDLFDPSFQLTFFSVIAIVALAVPLMTRMQQVGAWRPSHETPFPPAVPPWFRSISEMLFWSDRAWKAEMATSNIRYRLFKSQGAIRLEQLHLQRPIRFVAAAVILSASVQLGMLPLVIIYFHRISFASLLLNIFVGVEMAGLVAVCLIATVIAHLSSSLAAPLIGCAEKIEWLMVHAIDPISRLGVASIRIPHYRGIAAVIYVLYLGSLGILAVELRRWNPLRPAIIVGASNERARAFPIKLGSAVFVLLLLVVILHPLSAVKPDGKLRVDFLDVGQGDSALVTMPDGTTLLIDGGGRPNIDWKKSDAADGDEPFVRDTRSIGERVVSEFLWSRGLDRVDYILPTHADADHIDGLNDIASNFKVRAAIVSRTPAAEAEYARFAATMKSMSVPVEQIGAGDILRFGDVSIDVLWPLPDNNTSAPWRNNDGTVLRLRYGNKALLFTADIEKEAETKLVAEGADLSSNIVKVAHHGSRTSSTPAFVNATRASLAVISVGRTSIFGHPNKEVVERWQASGAQVLTTGQKGTISVTTDGKNLTLNTFVSQ
jgi:competence protein ComEC